MRTFTIGSVTDREVVVIEVVGSRLKIVQMNRDGASERSEKALGSESEARAECERMARELIFRGYAERSSAKPAQIKPAQAKPTPVKPARPSSKPKPVPRVFDDEDDGKPYAVDQDEEPAVEAAPVLARLAPAPVAPATDGAPKKKAGGKKRKKRKKGAGGEDALDKRVIGAVVAVAAVVVVFVGYLAYDAFLKPPTIVGVWEGSMLEFEIGRPMVHTQYKLVLDDKKRASMTLQEKFTSKGTYSLKGNRLKLKLNEEGEKDEPGEEALSSEREYKIALGRVTLDLFDPESGKKVVELIRFREKPSLGKGTGAKPAAAPPEVALGPADKSADDRLAAVEFAPKDNAFKLRHPTGWVVDTGSRPDNSYSWGSFTSGSAKIEVFADVTGSLMVGSNTDQHEEGSETAPVHSAHMMYQKTASEQFSDYKESKPALFKDSHLGEGRIASFTASGGGLFGSRLRGCRVTLLTNDRRITVLCQCPAGDFEKLKPTFLAVCRSLSR